MKRFWGKHLPVLINLQTMQSRLNAIFFFDLRKKNTLESRIHLKKRSGCLAHKS